MSQITNHNQKNEIVAGKPRQVLATTKIEWEAFRYTDNESAVHVGFAAVFGKDPQTGEEHIAVVNPTVLAQFLSVPSPHIRDGILARRRQRAAPAAELPEGKVGSFDLGEVG